MNDAELNARLRAAEAKARKKSPGGRKKGLEAMGKAHFEEVVRGWEKDLPPAEVAHQKSQRARRLEQDRRKSEWT